MYRNAYWNSREKCINLRTWNEDGERITVSVPFKPYLYYDSAKGKFLSIFNTPIEKKEFKTPYERKQFVDSYIGRGIYDNFKPDQQFLLDRYWDKLNNPDFTKNPLRIIFFDIEVDPIPTGEFPSPEEAKAEINIITAYDSIEEKYHIFSKNVYNGNDLIENSVFHLCKNEKDLLKRFLGFWTSNDYPDIVTAWNLNNFDMPYVVNRIKRVLGELYYKALSPYNNIFEYQQEDKNMHKYIKYDIAGVDVLDMIDVYAKFKITKQESYKLDFIAEMELGYGKVDYEGMTIYEFMERYWDRFVEYNVRDVELLVKLEEKLQYFQILRNICNMGCVNYTKGLGTIAFTNGCIAVRARARNRALHVSKDVEEVSKEDKPGGFVSAIPGIHEMVFTVDASSLYPSLVMSLNISPETKIGVAYFTDDTSPKAKVDFKLQSGRIIKTTRGRIEEMIKVKNYIIAQNGCIFRQDEEGIFPQYMREVFALRKECKNQMKKIIKKNEILEKELETASSNRAVEIKNTLKALKKDYDQYNIRQYAYKIQINSAYGAISSPHNPIGDVDLANAITTTGSTSIRHVNVIAKTFVKKKLFELVDKRLKELGYEGSDSNN